MTIGTLRIGHGARIFASDGARPAWRDSALGSLAEEIAEVLSGAIADPVREGLARGPAGSGLGSLGRSLLADLGLER